MQIMTILSRQLPISDRIEPLPEFAGKNHQLIREEFNMTMHPLNQEPECSACIYYDVTYSQCRKRSPQVTPETTDGGQVDTSNDLDEDPGNFPRAAYDDKCGEGRFRMIQHSQESKLTFALLPTLLSYAQWEREGHTDEWWTRATYRWPRI